MTQARRGKWVIGNWKMHGRSASVAQLVQQLLQAPVVDVSHVALAVPTVYLAQVAQALAGHAVLLAAQDASAYLPDGAYTGEVSAAMLHDVGCRYVLIGHSERRQYQAEEAALLACKITNVHAAGMIPVLCVGEPLSARESGEHLAYVNAQIDAVASVLATLPQVVVAYEPVWAIGTGLSASIEQIRTMHENLRASLVQIVPSSCNIALLYGGSVKPENAAALFALNEVDGALVGGAALNAQQFTLICEAAVN